MTAEERHKRQEHYPVGIFTTSNRDHWASMRGKLINLHNQEILETIQVSFRRKFQSWGFDSLHLNACM